MRAIRHLGIVVSDLEKALHFYRDLLGLKEVKRMDESGDYMKKLVNLEKVSITTVKLAADDGNLVELIFFRYPSPRINKVRQFNEVGASHVSFTVDDLEKEHRRLSMQGVEFNASPQISPDGYAKVSFCKDPDGTLIELVEVLKK